MYGYRIELTPDDNETFLVTCPALPIVATFGETGEEARRHAVDAIETALASMIDDGEEIPAPEPANGENVVGVPLLTRSEEHTSELQSLMRISYAVFCLKKKNK